jgi:hypothetical protein
VAGAVTRKRPAATIAAVMATALAAGDWDGSFAGWMILLGATSS